MVPMGERAGLTIILINGGHTGSGLKGTPVGSSISSGRTTSWRKNRKERNFHPFVGLVPGYRILRVQEDARVARHT